jgi:translation initiation factor 2 beta subunit (eIF-2beta)/eIF-5
MLARLLIRKGSVLKAKLRIAKRLSKARAVTKIALYITFYIIT